MTTEAATTAEPASTEETIEQIGARIFVDDGTATPANDAGAVPVANDVEPPKADPVAERASARILANQRAEQRAAKVRAELAAERAEIAAERTAIAEAKALKEQFDAALMSPSKLLELAKKSPKEFLEALATEHEPEAIAKREVAGTRTEVQELKAEVKALRDELEAKERAVRMRAADTEAQQAGTGFLEFVATNAEKYPSLFEVMGPQEVVNAAFACLHEVLGKDAHGNPVTRLDAYVAEHGKPPEDDEIAEFLEQQAKPRAQARSEWRARIGKNAPALKGTPSEDVRATQMERGPSPRTLTSRAASEKAAAAPAWSQEAADEESLRIIRTALSG